MKLAKTIVLTIALAITAGLSVAGEARFSTRPTARKANGKTTISFAVSGKTDVEVAILDAKGKVVRHLAAGVLGAKTPPPAPLKPGLSQSLTWDGQDDYGAKATGGPFKARVRAGMGVKLERIVGGDPYAYYSKEMGQGDHAAWRITGLEAKSDGKVYVLGNVNNYGPAALRQYDAEGNFLKTVFPPPAGKPIADVKGWGVTVKADGTYMPQYNDLSSPALSKTFICGTRGNIATLIPSPGKNQLLLEKRTKLMTINTDGTIPADAMAAGLFVRKPSMFPVERNVYKRPWDLLGPAFTCLSPDGKHFYLSGVFAGTIKNSRCVGAETTGAWRDGQLFKVDIATREAKVFFALPEKDVIGPGPARFKSPIEDGRANPYAAFNGVAVDAAENVFLCDRQNKRIIVLDKNAQIIREIPVSYPDAIAVNPKTKAIYVTTRFGHYNRHGQLKLLKFNDWSKDSKPSVTTLPLCKIGYYPQGSLLAVTEAKGKVFVWVGYPTLPVRIYQDTGAGLKLFKDFYEAGQQRVLDLQHMIVNPVTDDIYIADGWNNCFRITDWKNPRFERCMTTSKGALKALSLAIDTRNGYLYGHACMGRVVRYKMGGETFTPAPVTGSGGNIFTPYICSDWRIGLGFSDRGIAIGPDGSLVTLGALQKRGSNYSGPLNFFKADAAKAPWQALSFKGFGGPSSAGVRFDPRGNLYAGRLGGRKSQGKIYKYSPTGSLAGGNLFPTEPKAPAKVYDINYGYPAPAFSRTPRFGVDGYGRIYYPTPLTPQVSVIDNEGNAILSFGTYGNRDSMGGLKGDLVPTRDIPMAFPNSVDATDDYIYVSDIVNIRLLRLAKKFAAAETVTIQ
jgi:DNA-binding beta-propeller fold protein YncE